MVVIGTRKNPLLWEVAKKEGVTVAPGAFKGADLGSAGLCLIADFDTDSIPDLLQLFEKGSLVYRGKSSGVFHEAQPVAIALGTGRTGAFLGDYDADGQLDVFTVGSEQQSGLWSNRGAFDFVNTMAMTGELVYKGGNGAIGGATCDFNNDGRQDVVFFYDQDSPRLYFSRGFRCFGMAVGIDIGSNDVLPDAADGAQAGCMGDFDMDGSQDMVVVLENGDAYVLYVEVAEEMANCARVTLSSQGNCIGPLTVTGWREKRCLGAWNIVAGTREGFFGQTEAGPIALRWTPPGGEHKKTTVIVEDQPVRVVLDAAGR
jgi:hypothetical protein